MPKTGKHGRSQRSAARPKCLQAAFKLNEKNFNWSFRCAFWKHDGWKPCSDPCFFVEHIIEKLRQLEKRMVWIKPQNFKAIHINDADQSFSAGKPQ